jgi:hypothetical protein
VRPPQLAASIEQVSYNRALARHRAGPARFGAAVSVRTHKNDSSAALKVMPLSERCAKIALANLCAVLIDFRFPSHRASTALRSDVSPDKAAAATTYRD